MKKRIFAALMAMVLSSTMILPAFAAEDDGFLEASEENEQVDNSNVSETNASDDDFGLYDDCVNEEAIMEYTDVDANNNGQATELVGVNDSNQQTYSLETQQKKMSFGTQSYGSIIPEQSIVLKNTGNSDIKLIWKECDPESAFYMVSPQSDVIAAGQSTEILVGVNDDLGAGQYSATLLFADESDPVYDDGVQTQLSVTIVEDTPIIKRVTITPGSAQASPGSSLNFSASVEGEGTFVSTVTYSVEGNGSTQTTIDSNGHLSIGANENASTIKVKAQSNGDSSKNDVAIVSIKANMHTVNVYSSPSEGGSVSGGGNYKDGDRVVLNAYPNNGWVFSGWTIDNGIVTGSNTYEINGIKADTKAVAAFERTTVSVKASVNHKSMGKVYGAGTIKSGDSITLEAEEKDGYKFKCWMEGKKKISTDHIITISNVLSDKEYTAVFAKKNCTVKVASGDTTMGKVTGGGKVNVGDSVEICATANKGYKFVKWLWNDKTVSESAKYKVSDVQDDMCLVAVFMAEKPEVKICQISAGTTDGNGVISPAGNIAIEEGKSINFTVTPKNGYRILAIAVDGKQIDVESAFTFSNIQGNHTVVAAFAPNHNTVTPDKSADKAAKDNKADKTAKDNKADKTAKDNNTDKTAKDSKNGKTVRHIESDLYNETKQTGNEEYDENIMTMKELPAANSGKDSHDDDDDMDNEMDSYEGTLQSMNIDRQTAEEMIDNNEGAVLIKQAIKDDNLKINLTNDLSVKEYDVEQGMDAVDDEDLGNLSQMLSEIFDKDELLDIVSGDKRGSLSVCISKCDGKFVSDSNKTLIEENLPEGNQVGTYFNASFIKEVGGVSEIVSEFPKTMAIRLSIPDEIKAPGREYSVIRLHNRGIGDTEVTVLENIDDSDDTITFETDRFSTYAIIYKDINADAASAGAKALVSEELSQNAKKPVNVAIIVVALGALAVAIAVGVGAKKRRK